MKLLIGVNLMDRDNVKQAMKLSLSGASEAAPDDAVTKQKLKLSREVDRKCAETWWPGW